MAARTSAVTSMLCDCWLSTTPVFPAGTPCSAARAGEVADAVQARASAGLAQAGAARAMPPMSPLATRSTSNTSEVAGKVSA